MKNNTSEKNNTLANLMPQTLQPLPLKTFYFDSSVIYRKYPYQLFLLYIYLHLIAANIDFKRDLSNRYLSTMIFRSALSSKLNSHKPNDATQLSYTPELKSLSSFVPTSSQNNKAIDNKKASQPANASLPVDSAMHSPSNTPSTASSSMAALPPTPDAIKPTSLPILPIATMNDFPSPLRDPMRRNIVIQLKAPPVVAASQLVKKESLKIQSILEDKGKFTCLINDVFYREKDTVGEYTIKRIHSDGIIVTDKEGLDINVDF